MSLPHFFALSVCAWVLMCLAASSDPSSCPQPFLTLPTRPLCHPGCLARFEVFQVSSLEFFPSGAVRFVLTCSTASSASSGLFDAPWCCRRICFAFRGTWLDFYTCYSLLVGFIPLGNHHSQARIFKPPPSHIPDSSSAGLCNVPTGLVSPAHFAYGLGVSVASLSTCQLAVSVLQSFMCSCTRCSSSSLVQVLLLASPPLMLTPAASSWLLATLWTSPLELSSYSIHVNCDIVVSSTGTFPSPSLTLVQLPSLSDVLGSPSGGLDNSSSGLMGLAHQENFEEIIMDYT